jgi:hypothetical protein
VGNMKVRLGHFFWFCFLRNNVATAFTAVSIDGRIIGTRSRSFPLLYLSEESSSLPDTSSSASVGDYVRGVHGGKYQFEDAGGMSFAGSQFAESLYASDDSEGVYEEIPDTEELPRWAQAMGTPDKLGLLHPLEKYPVVSVSSQEPTIISITNDERTWEQFYSKVVEVSLDGTILLEGDGKFIITPERGNLAPRGGSSNLCDPSKPYSDSTDIQIQVDSSGFDPSSSSNSNHYLLVIGTEAEKWYYWLQIT